MATKVLTGKCRASFLHVFTPKAVEEGGEKKYSVSLIIPKSDKKTIRAIEEAIEEAYEDGKAKFGGKLPRSWKNPLRDGDEERPDDPAYEDSYFVNANSSKKPGLVDRDREEIIDEEELYSGCYIRASLNFYAFNVSGNKGVAAGLNNIQKLADGERLSGGSSAEEDFADDYEDDEKPKKRKGTASAASKSKKRRDDDEDDDLL